MNSTHSRRALLGGGAGAAAAGALGLVLNPTSASASPLAADRTPNTVPPSRVGLQLWTVRTLIGADYANLELVFEAVHDAGVRELELAGTYYDKTTPELKRIAEAHGLRITSNHFGPRAVDLPNPWLSYEGRMQIFQEAQSLGRFPYVGTGSTFGFDGADDGVEGYKRLAEAFNVAGEHAVKEGFKGFFFHNHDREFALVDGRPLFHTLLENTDPRHVSFEVDLGWVAVAGEDPYYWVRRYGDRFIAFHVKDVTWDPNGNRTAAVGTRAAGQKYRFADLGKGDIPWTRTFSAIKDLRNYRYFLEHDDAGDAALNPAGSLNTVWRGCSTLEGIDTSRRR
ncbi:sugar phosphate isomerase/epimerase [Terracoccus luteus]|uniref:Sugar phosphate isomerase/epimerase n=1 Tax=Terracoccus luteus TaxID=53356 RepID=A0A495Y363_9MICO|nr:sugar phosphate isomerase/epimerase [Terracoccus luteus]RKT79905.1 sugar phosphate isomerase/epimerase [Terracoccus luteus]